jgi:putative ABC transport system permease protein
MRLRSPFAVAWYQLIHQKMKLVAATAGVVVAVMLMLVQLGIRQGAMENSVSFTRRIQSELVVVSPRTKTIFQSAQFPRRLLVRLAAIDGVMRTEVVYMSLARWKNKWAHIEFPITVYGVNPSDNLLDFPGIQPFAEELRMIDRFLFDGKSRDSYGPVISDLERDGELETELNQRRIHVIGSIDVGISIGNDGNVFCSHNNFMRVFPGRPSGSIDLGLVQLASNTNVIEAKRQIADLLGHEAKVLTRQELIDAEIAFVRKHAPIDFIFGMGTVVGFFIGFVVVYQILYTEVTNHLPQLATMKAVGFTDVYLLRIVLSQAIILSLLGYVPGFWLAIGLYRVAEEQMQMPFAMTAARSVGVFIATLVMCGLSAMIAVRKAWTADPAEVF